MREQLKARCGLRGEFHATFIRRGISENRWGKQITALFVDVRDERGQVVTDHLWFFWGKQMSDLHLLSGERVRFMATVAPYLKRRHNPDTDPEPAGEGDAHAQDYKLFHPSNMRREESFQPLGQQALPLGDGNTANGGETK